MLFHYAECQLAECRVLFTIMPNSIILSVVVLSVAAPFFIFNEINFVNFPQLFC
jgi:hypothetical protein